MAVFDISDYVCMGWSCSGPVYEDGKGSVVLSKGDVETLVKLIREKGITDVEELGLKSAHPRLYQKLYRAYQKMEIEAKTRHWLRVGIRYGLDEKEMEAMKKYCRRYCGWHFDLESHLEWDDEMDEMDEDDITYEENMDFQQWFEAFIEEADIKKMKYLLYQVLEAEFDDEDAEPYVQIPKAIIDMAEGKGRVEG